VLTIGQGSLPEPPSVTRPEHACLACGHPLHAPGTCVECGLPRAAQSRVRGRRRVRRASVAILLLTAIAALLWGPDWTWWWRHLTNPWTAWTSQRESSALEQGKTVAILMDAEWVLSMNFVQMDVLRDLAHSLSRAGYVVLRHDLTHDNTAANALLGRAGRDMIPIVIFVDPDGNVWAEEVGPLIERMRRTPPPAANQPPGG